MSLNHTIHGVLCDKVEHLNGAFSWVGECNDFRYGTFVGRDSAKAGCVKTCVHLLYELERQEREYERLVFQHNDEHVLAKFYGFHNTVESDFSAIFPFMIVPDDYLMTGGRENQDDEVCLVHHLDDLNRLVQVLNLFLDFVT